MRLKLNRWYGGEASGASAPTPFAQVLFTERRVHMARQFGIHVDGFQLGKVGELEPSAADAAIIHSLGFVHLALTCQSASLLVSRLAFSTRRRTRRKRARSFGCGVGRVELMRMHCSKR